MMLRNLLFLLIFSSALPALAVDTILVNGKIVTVDDQFRVVQALAITKQRVVATGSSADIRKLADGNTKVIDLQGLYGDTGPHRQSFTLDPRRRTRRVAF